MSIPPDLHGTGQAGWRLQHLDRVGSTNDLARGLAPWTALRADSQSSGRGRYGRTFQSDTGGLWLSAVVPTPGGAQAWIGYSIMVGCYLVKKLRKLGIPTPRLRWPNDIMVGSRKLGGLLLEQSQPDRLVVGLGINVTNQPWQAQPELRNSVTRLADVLPTPPDLTSLTVLALDAIADAHLAMMNGGLALAVAEFNQDFIEPVAVILDLGDQGILSGLFVGLTTEGHLRIQQESAEAVIAHHNVTRLYETPKQSWPDERPFGSS